MHCNCRNARLSEDKSSDNLHEIFNFVSLNFRVKVSKLPFTSHSLYYRKINLPQTFPISSLKCRYCSDKLIELRKQAFSLLIVYIILLKVLYTLLSIVWLMVFIKLKRINNIFPWFYHFCPNLCINRPLQDMLVFAT